VEIHLSRFSWRKNPDILLKAFAGVKDRADCQLVIGGRGWRNEHVKKIIDSLGIEDRTVFTGYLSKPDVIRFLNTASAFVFPSLYEGFGMPNLEAMACGCPVISSNISAVPEIVGDAGLLVDDPEDDRMLARKMITLSEDKSLQEQLRKKGLERASLFSWHESAKIVWDTYAGLA